MNLEKHVDVIVIGGGHAGTEAALAAARMGMKTLLLTQNVDTIGQMSCNPAIGGIGKGHLVKEVDALGGVMAHAADRAGIHFRTLNQRKGPAVRATRAQADRVLYKQAIRQIVESEANLKVFQQSVEDLVIKNDQVIGVVTQMGLKCFAKAVVLTVGTFLGGTLHIGESKSRGGRAGDAASIALAERLRALPFKVGRLKTGTPPRIDGKTVNFEKCQPQPGDEPRPVFSFMGSRGDHPQQVPCFITRTTEQTHEIIRENLHRSPMYAGEIEGIGPRYCPSIEDKVVRFADKSSHQIFIEPEGLTTQELYPNGISTSLPFDVQVDFVRSIVGFEKAHITRPGYAIEYDYFDPRGLTSALQTKYISGLFFAGQINGTTGYEEAAAQGLVAGINAALFAQGKRLWSPGRDEAYMGVLIDDLITNGTQEPYRMFTSRAEYRLILREDNADERLTPKGRELGLVSEHRWAAFQQKQSGILNEKQRLKKYPIRTQTPLVEAIETTFDVSISHETNAYELLKRPELSLEKLNAIEAFESAQLSTDVLEQVSIQIKYEGYISRQQQEIARLKAQEHTRIPPHLDYEKVRGLSNEVLQKLRQVRPQTIGQASRISGITPAAISLLLIYLKKQSNIPQSEVQH